MRYTKVVEKPCKGRKGKCTNDEHHAQGYCQACYKREVMRPRIKKEEAK